MALFNSASLDRGRGIHLGGIVALDSSVIMPEYLSNKLNGVVFYVPPRLYHVLYFSVKGIYCFPLPPSIPRKGGGIHAYRNIDGRRMAVYMWRIVRRLTVPG